MLRTLRGKFTLVYLGLAVLAALAGLAGAWNLFRLERSVNNLMTANYKSIDAVYHMMEAIERQDSAVLVYIGIDAQQGIDLFTQSQDDFLTWQSVERGNVTESGELSVLETIDMAYAQYCQTLYRLQTLPDQKARREYYRTATQPLFGHIKSQCRQLIQINETAMFAARQRTTDDAQRSLLALLAGAALVLVVGFAISQFFIRRFLRPIALLSQRIAQVREGNLDLRMEPTSHDETGDLIREFNDMTNRLQDYARSNLGTLLNERNRSVTIVQSISDPLLVLDAGWRIQLINEAWARAFAIERLNDAIGHHFLEVVHDGTLFARIEELAAGDGGGREMTLCQVTDRYYNLSVTRLGMDHSAAGAAGTIVALHDVTEIKELERVRTDFLASISHEFKTPLTSILMASSLLREGALGELSTDQAQAVQTVSEDGERLLTLVNDLLELMRIESGREVYHMEPCALSSIALAAAGAFRETSARQNIALHCDVSEYLPPVRADFEKIRWVLNNLISNAINYSTPGDAVHVTAHREGAFVHVSVRDTGIGIAPQHLERIFDKFVQIDGKDFEVRGTGLGLSVSKQIVQDHGGDISVSSATGVGSTFTFTLPVAGEEA